MHEQELYNYLRYCCRLKTVRFYIAGRFLLQVELEFYSSPGRGIVRFLEIYLSGYKLRRIHTNFGDPNCLVLCFDKYTHRNTSFAVLDALSKFIDTNTKIEICYSRG
ncbi:MAG: hypothetical protein GXO42_03005 [bacterium]|nr:hypothetical protein [bacterium]